MRHQLTKFARKLRKEQTPQEAKLWALVRRKSFKDFKFRRQYPIGNYIVDICCPEKRLVIELDGGQHSEEKQIEIDKERERFLKNRGYKILRFWNNDIDKNIEGVFDKIDQWLDE